MLKQHLDNVNINMIQAEPFARLCSYVAKDKTSTSTYTVKMYQMKPNVCSFHVECNNFKFLISSTRPPHA